MAGGGFGTFDFFKILGGILNIEGFFLNIGGFLEHWIFSRFFFNFFVLEAEQSPQTASGAPRVAARRPFLVPPSAVLPASDKKAVSGQILSLHRRWPTWLCQPNGPGSGRSIALAPMYYLLGLRTQPSLNTKDKTNPFKWLLNSRSKK